MARWPQISLAERFWNKVEKTSGCWLWMAYRNQDGYGCFGIETKIEKAPRVAWELTRGPIPAGLSVLHTCDNPPCVNPDHLYLGTHANNTRDRINRNRTAYGQMLPQSKLNEDQVLAIRQDNRLNRVIAQDYQVSKTVIGEVKRFITWKHVQQDISPDPGSI